MNTNIWTEISNLLQEGYTKFYDPEGRLIVDYGKGKEYRFKDKSIFTKTREFISTIVKGKVDRATYELRRSYCFAPCIHLREKNGHYYCNACGCGAWKMARLDEGKLWWKGLRCPLKHRGFWDEKKGAIR